MSVAITVNKSSALGGKQFTQSANISGDGAIVQEVSVSAGETGTLSTRTDNDTGIITVGDSGHSFSMSDRVDLFWTGGCRYGMAVTNVSGADITIDGGAGDNLPTQDTAVTLIVPVLVDAVFLNEKCLAFLLSSTQRTQYTVIDDSLANDFHVERNANYTYEWTSSSAEDSPFTGSLLVGIYVSHAGTVAATIKVGILYDN